MDTEKFVFIRDIRGSKIDRGGWSEWADHEWHELSRMESRNKAHDEHLRGEQVANFAGTQLQQGWSYRFDPQRPQRRVGRTDLVVERPGWAWGYNGRGK